MFKATGIDGTNGNNSDQINLLTREQVSIAEPVFGTI